MAAVVTVRSERELKIENKMKFESELDDLDDKVELKMEIEGTLKYEMPHLLPFPFFMAG